MLEVLTVYSFHVATDCRRGGESNENPLIVLVYGFFCHLDFSATSPKPDSRRLSAYTAGLQVVGNHFVAGSEDGDGRGHHLPSTGFFFFFFI